MQVVTPENFTQLVQTGRVDEFKPPEAAKAAEVVKPTDKPVEKPAEKAAEQSRDEDGKLAKSDTAEAAIDSGKENGDKTATAEDAVKKADDQPGEDSDDEDLPEKVRKKIGAKHRQMREAEEFAEREFNRRKAAERRAAELEQELAQAKSKSGPAQDKDDVSKDTDAPKPEDFKTVAEYADALVEYKLDKRIKAREEKAAKSAQESEEARIAREFATRQTATMKELPDYTEVLERSQIELPKHAMQYVMESEIGPKLAYHLAKHPQEADRIAQLSPIRAIAELGKLEVRLEKPASKQEAKADPPAVSKAPSPIKPLGGDGAVPVHKDPADMTFQELREYERQKSAERRARR